MPKKGPGCNDPQRRPARREGREPISGVGRYTLEVPLSLPVDGVSGWRQAAPGVSPGAGQEPGSRSDISSTAKLSLEWPTQ